MVIYFYYLRETGLYQQNLIWKLKKVNRKPAELKRLICGQAPVQIYVVHCRARIAQGC